MKIVSIQKVIKVGSSLAVTIPAKDAKYYNIQAGEDIEMSITRPQRDVELVKLTQELLIRHHQALKNLSQR